MGKRILPLYLPNLCKSGSKKSTDPMQVRLLTGSQEKSRRGWKKKGGARNKTHHAFARFFPSVRRYGNREGSEPGRALTPPEKKKIQPKIHHE